MLTNHPNPIVRRFMHSESRTFPDATVWLLCAGAILPAVVLPLLRLNHYPLGFFRLIAPLLMASILFLVVLINMGMVALAGRETNNEAHQLLYLTDVDAKQVAWGFVLWMVWRLRFWLAMCGWMIWAVGMSATILAYHTYHAQPSPPAAIVPTAPQAIAFTIIWALFATTMMVSVVGMASLSAFQGLLQFETLLRIPAMFALIGVPAGFFMTMGLAIASDYAPVAAAMVLAIGMITLPILLTGRHLHIGAGKLVEVAVSGWWNATIGWAGMSAWGIVAFIFAGLTGVELGPVSAFCFVLIVLFLNSRRVLHFWGDPIALASATTAAVHGLAAAVWLWIALQESALAAFSLLLLWALLTGLLLNLVIIGFTTVNAASRFVWRTIDYMEPVTPLWNAPRPPVYPTPPAP